MPIRWAKEGDEPREKGSWWVGDGEDERKTGGCRLGEKRVGDITGGKVCVQREECCNRTVEHIALGTRLLLLLQMVGRRLQQIYVSL